MTIERKFFIFSRAASVLAALVGFLVLIGWALDVEALKSVSAGLVTMKANTALAFLLSGLSLWLLCPEPVPPLKRRLAQGAASVAGLVGGLTFVEDVSGMDLGIDQLLFQESPGAIGTSAPGRMAPTTAFNFFLIGGALLSLARGGRRSYRLAQLLALPPTVSALLGFVGYAYGVRSLYTIGPYTSMAAHTVAAFALLCAALFAARPHSGLTALFAAESAGGYMVRRVLPVMLVILVALGWIRLQGEQAGLYDTQFGLSFMVVVNVMLLTLVMWWTARDLDSADAMRKRMEEERNRFFRLSQDMLCTAGFDGYFKDLSPSWEKTLGYTKAELLAKPYLEFIHPEDREKTLAEAQKISEGHTTLSFENRYRCKDGSYRWFLWTATPVVEEQLMYASARDVTERKQAEDRLRTVVESASSGMLMVNRMGDIALVNSQIEQQFGYSRAELLGRSVELLVPPRFRPRHSDARTAFLANRTSRPMGAGRDLFGLRKDGTEFPVEIGLNPIETPDGPHVLCTIMDITERKQAEEEIKLRKEQLEVANKELEAFSYSVSHDLRAPLRHIDGFASLLQKHAAALDEKGRRHLATISDSAKQMGRLIDDLLLFSRTGRAELHMTPVNLANLVKEVQQALKPDMPGKEVAWTIGTLPEVHGDPSMLRQVLANLIGNAVKYTSKREKARIEVGCMPGERERAKSDEVVVFVRDNGAGFDQQYAHKLFGVFQRLHSAGEFEGTGIGLANVRRIVARHGGRTWAEGTVNEGATFYFSLPASNGGIHE